MADELKTFKLERLNEHVGPWWKYLVLTDRYSTYVQWRIDNQVPPKECRVATSMEALRGIGSIHVDTEIVVLATPGVKRTECDLAAMQDVVRALREAQAEVKSRDVGR